MKDEVRKVKKAIRLKLSMITMPNRNRLLRLHQAKDTGTKFYHLNILKEVCRFPMKSYTTSMYMKHT